MTFTCLLPAELIFFLAVFFVFLDGFWAYRDNAVSSSASARSSAIMLHHDQTPCAWSHEPTNLKRLHRDGTLDSKCKHCDRDICSYATTSQCFPFLELLVSVDLYFYDVSHLEITNFARILSCLAVSVVTCILSILIMWMVRAIYLPPNLIAPFLLCGHMPPH